MYIENNVCFKHSLLLLRKLDKGLSSWVKVILTDESEIKTMIY